MDDLPLAAEFRAFAAAPRDAIAGALLVQRVIEGDCAENWVRAELERLAASVGAAPDPRGVCRVLARAGFRGAEDYYATANSALERVLRTRRGIPITLALVIMGVAQACGLVAVGINFPRHFLVRVDDILLDPFTLATVEADWLDTALAGQDPATRAQALAVASPRDIGLRMLNNLRGIAQQRGETARALDLTGYQLLLGADPLGLHLERAELWLNLGVPDMARHEPPRRRASHPTDNCATVSRPAAARWPTRGACIEATANEGFRSC